MTQRERLLTALRGETPDQVPVTWELVWRFAYALVGRVGWKAFCDCHRQIGSAIFNLQSVGPRLNSSRGDGYSVKQDRRELPDGSTEIKATIDTPGGSLVQTHRTGYAAGDPTLGKTVDYFIKSRDDYRIFTDYLAETARTAVADNSEASAARDYIGDDGLTGFWMGDSLYRLAVNRRDTDFILDLADEPSVVEPALEAEDGLVAKSIEAFNESAADVMVYDICWASTSLLNPEMVRRFVIPRAKKAVEAVADDKIIGFFTTGRIRDVLPDLVDCGPAFIEHFDVLGDCDLAEVKKTFGDRICVVGNYSPVVLARGTLDEARREAQRCLDAAMAGGGYILSTSDEVPADAKLDNMKAVVEYVAEHGRY